MLIGFKNDKTTKIILVVIKEYFLWLTDFLNHIKKKNNLKE